MGNDEILKQTHDLLNKDELKLLSDRMTLDDENKSLSKRAYQYLKLFDKVVHDSDNEDEDTDVKIDDEIVCKWKKTFKA